MRMATELDSQLTGSPDRERQITDMLFSGELAPGAKITERSLARNMGFSRIPAREMMAKLVTRGVLIKDDKNRSVRLRNYSAEEVLELFEVREALEVAAARLACRRATKTDLLQMEVLCDLMDEEIGSSDFSHWAALDCHFHETMVRTSHNSRFIDSFDSLIRECQYVFYRHPSHWGRPIEPGADAKWSEAEKNKIAAGRCDQMRKIVEEHRKYLDCIRRKDADAVQDLIRTRMQELANGLVRTILSQSYSKTFSKKKRSSAT